MKLSMRWFGPDDPVSLSQIRQIPGVQTVVSTCHVPAGQPWVAAEVQLLRQHAEQYNLSFAVVEGLPVHESIKLGDAQRDRYIENYIETIRILGQQGIKVACYNFMPVFGWIRTNLQKQLPDGSSTLSFDWEELGKIDPEANELSLPGWNFSSRKEEIAELMDGYHKLGHQGLQRNLQYFLEAVVPEAEKAGVKLAIHPDDPPLPLFGLPRVVSNRDDLKWLTSVIDSECNGITLCTGSLGCQMCNDVVSIAKEFAATGKIPFVHARNVQRLGQGNFYESGHRTDGGSLNMAAILSALHEEKFDGYLRPDHGRMIWGETGRPGYGLFDRAMGATYLAGLWEAIGYNSRR